MCGIAGEIRLNGATSDANWPALTAAMRRRGPDGEGLWTDGKRCTLAFRRLAILDLTASGDQPLVTSDGNAALVLNGEIYNFRELRSELSAKGHGFRGTGDAEVALHALQEWGKSALERFNGMFALAFYSKRDATLLLARDHAGIKPLYVMHDEHGLFFASQFDQILAHPWAAGRGIAPMGRSLYLRLGYVPSPHGIIEGTELLPAGTWLESGANGESRRGRHFTFPESIDPDLRGDQANEAVEAAIGAAVRRQLASDVPVGVFLSGGIDSPLVAAHMSAAGGAGIPAFTISTEDPALDESQDASRYAQELGLTHNIRRARESEALSLLPSVVGASAEPFADYSLFPTLLVSQFASEQVKVVLSGDGGDELFWGYAYRFSAVMRLASKFRQPHWLRDARWALAKYAGLGQPEYETRRPSIGDWYRARHSRIPEGQLERVFPTLGPWPVSVHSFDYRGWEADETAQWLRRNEFEGHLAMVLQKVDRGSMYHSLEVRVPLLDREVIATALRVDWRSCLDVKETLGKLPLRRALERHVQRVTIPKRGFSVPMEDWLRGPLRQLFEDRLFERKELAGLPVDLPALRQWFSDHLARTTSNGWGLWVLLSLALWEDRYLAGRQ